MVDVRSGAVTEVVGPMGQLGTGANLAVHRRTALRVGGFDPALDVGTPTNGGGDLDMLYRVLRAGHTVAYEPAAVVWHRHRTSVEELARQLDGHGAGQVAHLLAASRLDRRDTAHLAAHATRQLLRLGKRTAASALGRDLPLPLATAEMRGFLGGPFRYRASRRAHGRASGAAPVTRPATGSYDDLVTIASVDLAEPLADLPADGATVVVVHVLEAGRYLTSLSLPSSGEGIGRTRLAEALAAALVDRDGGLTIDLTAAAARPRRAAPSPSIDLADLAGASVLET
jgi:hypothetical protein